MRQPGTSPLMKHRGAMKASSEGLSEATPLERFSGGSHRVAMPARGAVRARLASLRDAFMRRSYEGCRFAQPLATGWDGSAIGIVSFVTRDATGWDGSAIIRSMWQVARETSFGMSTHHSLS